MSYVNPAQIVLNAFFFLHVLEPTFSSQTLSILVSSSIVAGISDS